MLLPAIENRRSIRRFKIGDEVSDEQVRELLTAAMMAPSACNTRAWEFLVVRSRDILDKIRSVHPYTGMLATASLAIIVCALPDIQGGISVGYFPQDCAAATENILIQAVSMELGGCWCGVYPNNKRINEMRKLLNLSDDVIPFNVIAIGVPDEFPAARGYYDETKIKYK